MHNVWSTVFYSIDGCNGNNVCVFIRLCVIDIQMYIVFQCLALASTYLQNVEHNTVQRLYFFFISSEAIQHLFTIFKSLFLYSCLKNMHAIIELCVCTAVRVLVPNLLKRIERLRGRPHFLNLRLNGRVVLPLVPVSPPLSQPFNLFSSDATPRCEHFDK